ncbi:hypothetical protein OG604_39360 [Streptomyces sp. NBC_01231]|nr:hypothetical protein OG604_39360 [Streptomyces sp. NBC_01231]
MRRSARALSAAVLAGAVIGLAVPVAFAEPTAGPAAEQPAAEQPTEELVEEQPTEELAAEQPVAESGEDQPVEEPVEGPVAESFAGTAAEVSPSSVSPGGNVTVSVSCDPTGGSPPESITATSQAVDSGSVQLGLVSGNDEAAGPAYKGTARIAPDASVEDGADAAGKESPWTVDGTCPTAPGEHGKKWSAPFTVNRGSGTPCTESYGSSCGGARPCTEAQAQADPCHGAVQHGVRAGEGGAFTDSPPALVAGGLLIAGALGAAVHRLRRKEPATDD